MPTLRFFRIVAATSVYLSCGLLFAQRPLPTPKHGGRVVAAEHHYIEVLAVGDEYRFHLMDSTGRTMPTTGLFGIAYLRFADGETANPTIEPVKNKEYLRTVVPRALDFTMVISIKAPEGFISAQFDSGPREALPAPVQHGADDGHGH
ncbi:MAG: hypothetical protein JNN32_00935 [Flavobacteriales bacterium]|jgi:hypothetical protein|nr:hypothetical protein [Flavobacteriales bacterium]